LGLGERREVIAAVHGPVGRGHLEVQVVHEGFRRPQGDGWYPSGRPLAADAMTPSAALIRAILIASGVPVTGSGTVSRSPSDTWPNNEQGFGRVLLSNVLPLASLGDT